MHIIYIYMSSLGKRNQHVIEFSTFEINSWLLDSLVLSPIYSLSLQRKESVFLKTMSKTL